MEEARGGRCAMHVDAAGLRALRERLADPHGDWSDSRLCGLDLDGLALDGARLERADLRGVRGGAVRLNGARLAGANLWGAVLPAVDLRGADLRGAQLGRAQFAGAGFDGACLDEVHAWGANFERATLELASCEHASFAESWLPRVRARGIRASGSSWRGCGLDAADLREAVLVGADMSGASLQSALLTAADLRGAELGSTRLLGADLQRAQLGGARFAAAELWRAPLEREALRSAYEHLPAPLAAAADSLAALRVELAAASDPRALEASHGALEARVGHHWEVARDPERSWFARGRALTGVLAGRLRQMRAAAR